MARTLLNSQACFAPIETNCLDPSATVIALEKVSKTWPARWRFFRKVQASREILCDVTFSVGRGEIFVLLGENGAGKTSILKIIAGLACEDAGTISLLGESSAAQLAAIRRRHLTYSGGERGFYFRLTVRENLSLFGTLEGLRGKLLRSRIDTVSEIADLADDVDRRFGDLSSGMRQRVALARALLSDPDIVLLDEPTRTLDPVHALSIRSFIRDTLVRSQGKTVLLATNALDEAFELADRIGILRETRLFNIEREPGTNAWPQRLELFPPARHA